MDFKMKITIGDYSHDGHNQTSVVALESNYSPEAIKRAYEESILKTGITPHNEWAAEYQDMTFNAEALIKAGVSREVCLGEEDPEEETDLAAASIDGPDHYIVLLEAFCQLSLPDLTLIEVVDPVPDLQAVLGGPHGFGYGLLG